MRRWRRRLLRTWRIGFAYIATVALTVVVIVSPLGQRPGTTAVTTRPETQGDTGESPPGEVRGGALATPEVAASILQVLARLALRTCLPWPALIDQPGGGSLGLSGSLLSVIGVGAGASGILASGIPAIAHSQIDVYSTEPADGTVVPVITRMPATAVRTVAGGPVIGVYHTHSRESFLPELPEANVLRPDDAHTQDPALTVIRLGKEVASTLNSAFGIGSVHSPQMHDLDGKLGAYVRSEATVCRILKEYPSVRVLLDIHRDSQPRERTTVTTAGKEYARVMAVLGTDNPDWKRNEAFARSLLVAMESRCPGISIGVYPKEGKFNQQYLPGSVVLEVGGVENTLDEGLRTSRLIAEAIAELIRQGAIP